LSEVVTLAVARPTDRTVRRAAGCDPDNGITLPRASCAGRGSGQVGARRHLARAERRSVRRAAESPGVCSPCETPPATVKRTHPSASAPKAAPGSPRKGVLYFSSTTTVLPLTDAGRQPRPAWGA